MVRWIEVGSVSDCPPGSIVEVVADDRIVALANVEGQWFALDGICPHQGGPLGQGELRGSVVTCPWHGWQFDVCTGRHTINAGITQPQLPVRVVGDAVEVGLD